MALARVLAQRSSTSISIPSIKKLQDLPWEIEAERPVDAAFERTLHDEVETREAVELIAPYRTPNDVAERALDASDGKLRLERGVMRGIEREDRHVRGIALVPGAGVGDLAQRDPPDHATIRLMRGLTISRSTKTE